MSVDRVYTDPAEPGAPQEGDIVVVVIDGAPGTRAEGITRLVGAVARIRGFSAYAGDRHPWHVRVAGRNDSVHTVRWPTESEILHYQLGQGDQP